MVIPRIIHQTVRDKSRLHPIFSDSIRRITSLNPGWVHRLYDDQDIESLLARNCGAQIGRAYRALNPSYGAARADLFRYALLRRVGGVYLDIKSSITAPLDVVLAQDDQYLLSHWDNGPDGAYPGWGLYPELGPAGEYQQWFITAAPDHPFLAEVLDEVCDRIRRYDYARVGVGKAAVVRTTGPVAYTLAIDRVIQRAPFRLVCSGDIGFAYSILPRDRHERGHADYLQGRYYKINREPLVSRFPLERFLRPMLGRLRPAAARISAGRVRND